MISISEINDVILEVFDKSKEVRVSTVYEKDDDGFKLVIELVKLYQGNINIIYTKLIFYVDDTKTNLVKNEFSYLYDINCIYRSKNFKDINNLKIMLKNILSNKMFGDDIKILSVFMEKPAFILNTWYSENKINNISVESVEYQPESNISKCESLSFNFKISVNNFNILLNINKINKGEYKYTFNFMKKILEETKPNLNDFIQTIAETIKNNIEL